MTGEIHLPVLRDEVVGLLKDANPPMILDGTVGLGGHSAALLETRDELRVVGIDRDEAALALASDRLACFGDRVRFYHGNYRDAKNLLAPLDSASLGGALLDVGLSSLQLDAADRGFSLRRNGPLDMRMDPSAGVSAATWIADVSEEALIDVLREFGEERYARRIGRTIVRARAGEPIETTSALREIVHRAVPGSYFSEPIDPATRTFQAIRIAINDELGSLAQGLQAIFDLLAPGGILAVISFHSLEDRMVKTFFRERAADCVCPPDLPDCLCDKQVEAEILTKKPIVSTAQEVADNPRARSAKLRAAKKLV